MPTFGKLMKNRRVKLLLSATALGLCIAFAGAGQASASTPASQLLATYQPVTRFDPQERFLPTSVQSFVADATLEELTQAGWVVVDPAPEPGDLPGPGTGIWRLNQEPCSPTLPLGGLDCYAAAWSEGHGAPVVYGHVAHEGDETVLQYWYFYYADVYSYLYPPADFLWQAHEGDWEVVNVVLSGDEQPLEVGYSEHCTGTTRAWDATERVDGTHPVDYVAVGSHSNELTPGTHPIATQCIPKPVLDLLAQLHLPPPQDVAGGTGAAAGPPGTEGAVSPIRKIDDDNPSWVAFPGFWGELQYFHAPPPVGTVALGTSPVGPAYHAIWADPLGTLSTWPPG
jgi:hypothetical protein